MQTTLGYSPSISAYSSPSTGSLKQFEIGCPQTLSLFELDQNDNNRIHNEIDKLAGLAGDPFGQSTLYWLDQRYCALYYQHFHPCFPILHRGSLATSTDVPNLLKIIMIAIGACFSNSQGAAVVAETLSSAAMDMLNWHELPSPSSRTVDLQIAFLIEAYMLFRARRQIQKLSTRFEALTTMVC